ncbi:MAG: glucosamine-6-phosphate deaminase [Anaerolineae bacterium]
MHPTDPIPVHAFKQDSLEVQVYPTREAMGQAAARDVAAHLREILSEQEQARVVFAAAPSQNEFLAALRKTADIPWQRIVAFHMDEYVGLPDDAPQRFGTFLRERIFDLPFAQVNYLDGNAPDVEAECSRYAALLQKAPLDIVCAGIGENGHMAFNDPHVADFEDPAWVKPVTLDDVCRQQQVNDGAFERIEQVPKQALTMTMPALMSARHIACVVPGPTKAAAVASTLRGPIEESCPATIMRRHADAVLYLDAAAAERVLP